MYQTEVNGLKIYPFERLDSAYGASRIYEKLTSEKVSIYKLRTGEGFVFRNPEGEFFDFKGCIYSKTLDADLVTE